MPLIGDYHKIMSDHGLFNKIVYTPLSEAIQILKERQKDDNIKKRIEDLLNGDIPEPLRKIDRYGISGKQVATPNFDTRWFIELTKDHGLKTFFLEYHSDKFTSNNFFKHSLGQLRIHNNFNKHGDNIEEKMTIVDFNKCNGRCLKDIHTLWGEPLVAFHKRLFDVYNFSTRDEFIFYDESGWLKRNGTTPEKYYERDLLLYIYHGILFENFLLTGSDGEFTENILLPAFEKVFNLTGLKPLIVPIPPMEVEEEAHWFSYDKKIRPNIKL